MKNFSFACSLLADAEAQASTSPPETVDYGLKLLIVIVVCVAPFIVGAILARALRLREFSNRIGTVLLAITLGLAPFVYQIVQTGEFGSWKNALRWGIDLAGGTNLIYQVETEKAEAEQKDVNLAMEKMVSTISKRINPSGAEEVAVRRVGQDRIEIIIPGADPGVVAEKKAAMTRIGSLEFGIVANDHDHRSLIAMAQAQSKDEDLVVEGNQIVAVWREVAETESPRTYPATRTVTRKNRDGKDVEVTQVLILQEPEEDRVTGDFLRRASTGLAEDGSACVNFSFDSEGAMRFFRLTDRNKPASDGFKRQLAIILDGKVHSAPNLNSAIRDQGQITGNFTPQELQALVDVLNAGALQLPINPTPISEYSISPLLGADVQEKGLFAIVLSALVVFVFMLVYYRFAGLVADLALLLNLILIVGSMAICNATFTLPGLAALVLTIGMAVDTNVLIYERMREEMARGSSLRMVIHNGFDKALSAIIDSNITTLIAAVILYMIGTDQIKGFAVSLFIGITMSMFSALTFSHLLFDIAERKRWIRDKLSMMKLIGVTKFDFISKLRIALTFSIAFITLGVALVVMRGSDSLDIDFAGGSMVTFKFEKQQQIDDVRARLAKEFDSMSLERLALPEEDTSSDSGRQFRLRTKDQDVDRIRKGIAATFNTPDYELHRVTVEFTPLVAKLDGPQLKVDEPSSGSNGDDEVSPQTSAKTSASEPEKNEKTAVQTGPGEKPAEKSASTTEESKSEPADSKQSESKQSAPKQPDEIDAASKSSDDKTSPPDDSASKTKPVDDAKQKLPAESSAPAISIEPKDPFADAHRTELKFSSEISTTTATDYLARALSQVNSAYSAPEALIRVKGTHGSGLTAKPGQAKTFDVMSVEVRSSVKVEDLSQALVTMQNTLATTPIFEEVNNFAGSVAEDMRYLAMLALLASGVATIIYLWFRFTKADFGIAAVVAVFHDVLFTLACLPFAFYLSKTPLGPILGLQDFKLNLTIVAAFMTIIGYSLNDTIVIFDRVREIRGRNPLLTPQMINDSLNQTLSRTILTSLTVLMTVVVLYFFGGDGIHGFAFCMLVGTVVGTYSTVYIASPLLLWMWNREQRLKATGKA
jgi:SecD/SecF fusion protein